MRRHCLGPLSVCRHYMGPPQCVDTTWVPLSVWTLCTEVDWTLPIHVRTLHVLWVVSRIVSLWVSAKSQKSPLAAIQFNWCLTPGKVHIEKKSILFKILHLKNFIEKKKSVSVWNLTPTKVHIGKKSVKSSHTCRNKISFCLKSYTYKSSHRNKNQCLFEILRMIKFT